MDVRGWQNCPTADNSAPVKLNTSSWDSLADVCRDVFRFVNTTTPCQKRLVLHFVLHGRGIKIDFGVVKSAGVICILGIGFGIGSVLLYKFFCKFLQPILKKLNDDDEEKIEDVDEHDNCVDNSDNSIDGQAMGNDHSGHDLPAAYYSPEYGVAIGGKYILSGHGQNKHCVTADQLRNRHLDRQQRNSSIDSVGDSVCAETSSEACLNRNSEREKANETNESGFHDLEVVIDNESSEVTSVSPSLQVNYSPKSLQERNFKAILRESERQTEGSNKGRSELSLSSFDGLDASSVLLTPPSDDDLSPLKNHSFHAGFNPDQSGNSCNSDISSFSSEQVGYVSRLRTESLTSPSESIGDWSLDEEESDSFSPLPRVKSPERVFKQSLLQQLRDHVATSGKPDLPSELLIDKKSTNHYQSVDSLGGVSGTSTPDFSERELFGGSDLFIDSVCNFNQIEDELVDIYSEVDVLTSRLEELKQRALIADSEGDIFSCISPASPLSKRLNNIVKKANYIHEKPQSDMMSDSEKGSRNNSIFDHVDGWDMCGGLESLHNRSDSDLLKDYEVIGASSGQILSENLNATDDSKAACDKIADIPEKIKTSIAQQSNKFSGPSHDPLVHRYDSLEESQNHNGHIHDHSEQALSKLTNNLLEQILVTKQTPGSSEQVQESLEQSVAHESKQTWDSSEHANGPDSSYSASGIDVCRSGKALAVQSLEDSDIETDSACIEDSVTCDLPLFAKPKDVTGASVLSNIGKKWDIMEYAANEWRGDTQKSRKIKQGYQEIPTLLNYKYLYQIRGDNYCGIRATLFQILVNGLPVLKHWPPLEEILHTLQELFEDKSSGLTLWTFANRLSVAKEDFMSVMSQCISSVYSEVETACEFSTYEERVRWSIQLLNSGPDTDVQLMEGIKLLMLLNAIHLWRSSMEGVDVPVFVWLMFARDSSETPHSLVKNHLNPVGGSAGLEQVEMFLLGHTLKVTIQVARLQQYGEEDFVSYYPDEISETWPTVSLIAEDDRHYNVPVS